MVSASYTRHAVITATYVDRRDPAFARLDSGELRLGKRKARGECLSRVTLRSWPPAVSRRHETTKARKSERKSTKAKAQKQKNCDSTRRREAAASNHLSFSWFRGFVVAFDLWLHLIWCGPHERTALSPNPRSDQCAGPRAAR